MLYTIRQILEKNHINEADSVYARDNEAVKDFIVSAGDFFALAEDPEALKVYGCSGASDSRLLEEQAALGDRTALGDRAAFIDRAVRLEQIRQRLKALKNDEEDITHAHADEIKRLRLEKKHLMAGGGNASSGAVSASGNGSSGAACASKNGSSGATSASGNASDAGALRPLIIFKNCLYAMSFNAVQRFIPQLSQVRFRASDQMPIFTRNMAALKAAVDTGRQLGISGGPCLFGVHEVLVNVMLWDGSLLTYDFSSGRHFMANGDQRDLTLDMLEYGDRVKGISFINQKYGVTTQEYDSIHCLFEMARALGAKLAIPLPDMSYIKFFTNIMEPLPKKIAADAIAVFKTEAYKISDMYLEVIRLMALEYPEVEAVVVHGRDQALCRVFYEEREKYLTPTLIRRLTAVRGKTDAVLDYITMPALPYYLWGIRDVIQMDSLDETDSYRKCCKIHKGCLNLYAMMYPERLSGDGENTIFYAPLAYKEYL